MQPKKNEKADLSKNSSLYFIIGLTSVLFISWQAIEWKTYDRSGYGYEALNVEDDDDEEAALPSLMIVIVGLVPVLLMNRMLRQSR